MSKKKQRKLPKNKSKVKQRKIRFERDHNLRLFLAKKKREKKPSTYIRVFTTIIDSQKQHDLTR